MSLTCVARFSIATLAALWCVSAALAPARAQPVDAAPLPTGVSAVWDLARAVRAVTPTRERVCINGLWRWQPASHSAATVPGGGWGWFKVPGCWPGITDYMQKESQTLFAHLSWKATRLGGMTAAWYQREVAIPASWKGRRISLHCDTLNSFAVVYVGGARAGEMRFPGGELNLTSLCRAGGRHVLSMMVAALPLKSVKMSYTDTTGARAVAGSVERRGLCGDVWLASAPAGPRLGDVRVSTSVRQWRITLGVALEGLRQGRRYVLHARIRDQGKVVREFAGKPFGAADVHGGRVSLSAAWRPAKLWDLHTPRNQYTAELSVASADGPTLDVALPVRFGFRELWISGRDFILNGSRVFLCAVPLNNPQIGAALANYGAVRETLRRLKAMGVNFVYSHNYGCEPGTHLSVEESLRAADDEGVLMAISQPHFGQYDWKAPDAERTNGYARHAEFYVKAAGSHPSVVFYSMSHNATSYLDDQNPDMIDGARDVRPDWAKNGIKPALAAERIVHAMDPDRIVYHHSSGSLSAMYTLNFYANFTPAQEMSDWFEQWSTQGVKPLFLCEYGVPMTWDWAMYRGWHNGTRTFGSAAVPWEFCLTEWNAQFMGDAAYRIGDWEKQNLRWEADRFRSGALWHRWDYPHELSAAFPERFPIIADYIRDNTRAFRTLGISAFNYWEYGQYWTLRPGTDRGRKELKVDWANLQRPGFSPDYIDDRFAWMDVSYDMQDWLPTPAAEAILRNNQPLLAYIGGKASAVTSKDHNFVPGETVSKQLVIINNSRRTVTCDCAWTLSLPTPVAGRRTVTVATGQQARVPIDLSLPAVLAAGTYGLSAKVTSSGAVVGVDKLAVNVLPRPGRPLVRGRMALFDPKGDTARVLAALGVQATPIDASADMSPFDVLIVGKGALTPDGPAPDISHVRQGLKVVMFEQTAATLERRFGFRVAEYGLRWVFRRVPSHSALKGLGEEALSNWRGSSTIEPPRLTYVNGPRYAPTVEWCGIPVTRAWRAGNRGNVASVLIEKPARGDFLPILDGGFDLQYSPLMEYREGKGVVLFCQMDVSGRTEGDPAAERLAANILSYVGGWKPGVSRRAVYAGDPVGKRHLAAAGIQAADLNPASLSPDDVLVLGGAAGPSGPVVSAFVKSGGRVLGIALDEPQANAVLPARVTMSKQEHVGATFSVAGVDPLLAGIGPSDTHIREPRELPLVTDAAAAVGGGVLAKLPGTNVVLCQLAPYAFSAPDGSEPAQFNLRRTYRRTSFLLTRLLANMGVAADTPIVDRFRTPAAKGEKRWLDGLYLDKPIEWDDPYRFFCW